jgi:hypothetical protein
MDDFFHSIEFYTLALLVAFALLALIFGQKDQSPASTYIKAMDLQDGDGDESTLEMLSHENGNLELHRTGMQLRQDDTVNLVVTMGDGKMRLVEKKGLIGPAGTELSKSGSVLLDFVREGRYEMRYESDVTGQWRMFSYTHRPGNSKKIALKY